MPAAIAAAGDRRSATGLPSSRIVPGGRAGRCRTARARSRCGRCRPGRRGRGSRRPAPSKETSRKAPSRDRPSTSSTTSPRLRLPRSDRSTLSGRPIISCDGAVAIEVARPVSIADEVAVAQHGDAVGDAVDLLHAVADEHHRHAARLRSATTREQPLDLALRQRRRRLVHDQHAGVERQRAGDLDELLLGGAQACRAASSGAQARPTVVEQAPCASPRMRARSMRAEALARHVAR